MDIKIINFDSLGDDRGNLISLESNNNIPFAIERVYYLFNTSLNTRRGFHAHKQLKQVAVVLTGSCKFLLDDGVEKVTVVLDKPTEGLLIESLVWREMYDFSDDCVLMVLANDLYEEEDYIRDYKQFLKETCGD